MPGRDARPLKALREAQAAAQVERVFLERECAFLDGLLGAANRQQVIQSVVTATWDGTGSPAIASSNRRAASCQS